MSDIVLSTAELHDLIVPVLPHASGDKNSPELDIVRIEVRDNVLYAIASDRYTMAVTRHRLRDATADSTIAISRADAAVMLKLFKFDRNTNPDVQLTVGSVEAETILDPADRPALTVSAKDGNTLVLHGRDDRQIASWRKIMAKVIHREERPASPHLNLAPMYLSRWTKAMRKGVPLSVSFGAKTNDPVVIRVEDYFIGIWMPVRRTDDSMRLADSPWRKELPPEVESAEAAQAQERGVA
jgi:hypothetical protein